ncbi:MAG: hypothetical protein DHS20C11_27370 [Lysobacteraceae bacterium]|nr:MAG: hypothetical protein DHS20C11_27370 [Xanthomonadaceae bacterium]
MKIRALLATALLGIGPFAVAQSNSTYSAMYFHSQVRDASVCSMQADTTGAISFADDISNPAATCADAFGWKQMLEAIQSEFWINWANDETVWVSSPRPVCTTDAPNDCCFSTPGETPSVGYRDASGQVVKPADIGGPGVNCPYIPGEWGGSDETTFQGGKPISSHNTTFLRTQDPARVARQQEVEVVYRNDPFTQYTTSEELYSQAGLAKLFAKVSGEAANSIPYRPAGQGASYPLDAVMFKVDWIPEKVMLELGYISDHDNDPKTPPNNADHPYVTMKIKASTDNGATYKDGMYYLAAITGASKALPNWHWYAFEHVDNLGRCDYTGCNDSYGFQTTVDTQDSSGNAIKFVSNFITPHTESDQLQDGQDLFDLGKRYPSGDISDGLAALFKATGIGNGANPINPDVPQTSDPAWQSYRLKGTQTTFYNTDGYPTIVGASITEGGFVNTASCMSCHVQASVNAQGQLGVPGVGSTGRLNLSGIGTVVNGHPVNADYYDRGTTNQRAVRVDFVWGILFAQ